MRITDCRIRQGEKKNIGKPVGTFSCSCGFVYTRTGSDQSEEARFEWSSIQSYGIQWESRLKELWDDASQPLKEVAQKLGVNELTVKRRAISIGLTFPRHHSGLMRSNGAIPDRYQIKSKSHQEIRDTKRNDLLFLINNNPRASRTALLSLAPHLIDWLRQHDREWVDAALPLVKKKRPPTATIDWEKQDVMLSEAVKNAAVYIRSRAIPKRVSLTSVIKLIGYRSWIQKRLVKLPLTSQALDTHLESFEDYSIRRIAWTAESFRKEGRTPSIAMLSKRAGIKGRLYGKSKRVQSLLASTSRN